ncbi:hypothetical protein FO488_16010 [Geobacter sp. FeAm09]|uniref:hypothetical protein n=1 Tax=Geobacter sp. FeAm09 TaxID=2597769 RepID=UPI0011ECA1F2|nr:hypothetical protein [Geobacter sp. FeAm09]QEM69513.1 hypothetical protein FO488_16010 [Geobacter sp. FeAm09]
MRAIILVILLILFAGAAWADQCAENYLGDQAAVEARLKTAGYRLKGVKAADAAGTARAYHWTRESKDLVVVDLVAGSGQIRSADCAAVAGTTTSEGLTVDYKYAQQDKLMEPLKPYLSVLAEFILYDLHEVTEVATAATAGIPATAYLDSVTRQVDRRGWTVPFAKAAAEEFRRRGYKVGTNWQAGPDSITIAKGGVAITWRADQDRQGVGVVIKIQQVTAGRQTYGVSADQVAKTNELASNPRNGNGPGALSIRYVSMVSGETGPGGNYYLKGQGVTTEIQLTEFQLAAAYAAKH